MKPNIITDRTIYDVCAFTLSAKSIGWTEKCYFTNILMTLRDDYDAIIYVSPDGVEIEDNGVRTTDAKYREQIDLTIQNMLDEYPPKKLIRVSGSTEERIATILSQLN
jgi:nicotinamide riboside kinase